MTKTLSVSAIKEGTVIDHIPKGRALKILQILQVSKDQPVTLGTGLKSKSMGYKDLIKIEHCELSPSQLKQISVFAPAATIIKIKGFEVVDKRKATMPEFMNAILLCPNQKCITRHENIPTKFAMMKNLDPPRLRCLYCEKTFSQEEVR